MKKVYKIRKNMSMTLALLLSHICINERFLDYELKINPANL